MKKIRLWAFTFLLASTLFLTIEGHADSNRSSIINTNGMVRLVYFLPNDRPARPDRMAALRQLIKDAQQFFADEMHRNGFGRKTFTVETDDNGEPVVHRIDGKFSEEHYYNSSTDYEVWAELLEHFDNFRHVYFVAIDLSNETLGGGKHCGIGGVSFFSSNRGPWLRNRENPKGQSIGGFAIIPASGACFEKLGLTAHELGHAFGLPHDFREGRSSNYVMAYGSQTHLSKCAAEWLSASDLFNNKSLSRNEPGEIQLLELQPHNQDTISLRFQATDSDGLHHAQLVLPEGLLGPILFNCQQLNGKTSTVEFAISVAELVHRITLEAIDAGRITLQIIDLGGAITWERFPIQLADILSDQKLTALEKISGDNQYGLPFTPLSPLVVKVIDQNGFAFSGEVAITFTVTAGDGTLSVTRTKTDKNGRAASMLTLGPNLGTNTVEVSAAGIEQTVTFNAVAKAAVDIPDSNLRAAIETTLGVALSNPIALSEMAALTRLEASNANISDLTGLEFASNLTELELGPERVANQWRNSNAVTDLSPLASLTRLTRLHLPNNSISDISAVAGLTNLTWLNLWGNPISDISPVVGLTNLTDLYLGGNNISDISPLVANTGLGSGDTVNVQYNPLSYQSIHTHIRTLQSRGVRVEFDNRQVQKLLKISGDNQQGVPGTTPEQPFVVEVRDQNGRVFAGVPVTFAITIGDGTLSVTNMITDENGRAQSTLTLGGDFGTNTVEVSVEGIAEIATFTTLTEIEFDFSLPVGISLIHVPLKVTAVDGAAKTIQSVSDLYDALGGASAVNFLITYDSQAKGWRSYFVPSDTGGPADSTLTDDTGIVASMRAPTSIQLRGDALGTDGNSTITLNQGLNLVGLPLNDSRIIRVSDLFSLDGIGGNVFGIIVTNGGEFKLVARAGDPGDIPITGGQAFIMNAPQEATVNISGDAWTNGSGTAAAPPVTHKGIEVLDTTPVLGMKGAIVDAGTSVKVPNFRVTVKNLSTDRKLATSTANDEMGYRLTVVDIETGRAATVGDILEISAQSPNPLVGVEPVRYTVTAEDVKQSLIQLPELVAYEIPAETELLPNYPNPFNPETWIPYRLAEDAFVTLIIYDGVGQVVRSLEVGYRIAAVYESRSKAIHWDGRNGLGEQVASGVYFYTLAAGDFSATRRMLILK